jgi:hypothetical protein
MLVAVIVGVGEAEVGVFVGGFASVGPKLLFLRHEKININIMRNITPTANPLFFILKLYHKLPVFLNIITKKYQEGWGNWFLWAARSWAELKKSTFKLAVYRSAATGICVYHMPLWYMGDTIYFPALLHYQPPDGIIPFPARGLGPYIINIYARRHG